jgi:hypothetical protein
MHVDRLSDGLWRWTAPHPDWRDEPAVGWERDVACVYHESPDGILLLDPLVPSGDEGERFWRHLDQDVERVGLPPTVAVTSVWHSRSADAVRERYTGTQVLGVAPTSGCHLDGLLEDGGFLPGGCRVTLPDAPGDARMALVQCACHGLLWPSDLVVADGAGGLRRPPAAWFGDAAAAEWLQDGLPLLLPHLLELPVEHLVPAHGPVISTDARLALERALTAPQT